MLNKSGKKKTNYNIRNEKRVSLKVQGILKYNGSIINDFKHRFLKIAWKT